MAKVSRPPRAHEQLCWRLRLSLTKKIPSVIADGASFWQRLLASASALRPWCHIRSACLSSRCKARLAGTVKLSPTHSQLRLYRAAVSPTLGSLLDRIPPRRIILPSIVIFAAAMASLSLLRSHIAQFYVSYLLLGIVGNGTAQLSYSRSVLAWFRKRRGLALAIVLSGSGTGSIILPIIAQHVISTHGWPRHISCSVLSR